MSRRGKATRTGRPLATALAEPIVHVLIVVPRNGKHEQVDAPDGGSSDDQGQNQHVEAKGAHGASQAGGGSGKAAAMLRCRRRFLRLNQAMGCSASPARWTGRFRVRDTLRPWLPGSGPSAAERPLRNRGPGVRGARCRRRAGMPDDSGMRLLVRPRQEWHEAFDSDAPAT